MLETLVELPNEVGKYELGASRRDEGTAAAYRALAVMVLGFTRGVPRGTGEAETTKEKERAESTSWEMDTMLEGRKDEEQRRRKSEAGSEVQKSKSRAEEIHVHPHHCLGQGVASVSRGFCW